MKKTWFLGAAANEKPRSAACTANTGRATLPVSGGECPRGLPAYIILCRKVQWECMKKTWFLGAAANEKPRSAACIANVGRATSPVSGGECPRGLPACFADAIQNEESSPTGYFLQAPIFPLENAGGVSRSADRMFCEAKLLSLLANVSDEGTRTLRYEFAGKRTSTCQLLKKLDQNFHAGARRMRRA